MTHHWLLLEEEDVPPTTYLLSATYTLPSLVSPSVPTLVTATPRTAITGTEMTANQAELLVTGLMEDSEYTS